MTLVLPGKGLVLRGWPSKIEVIYSILFDRMLFAKPTYWLVSQFPGDVGHMKVPILVGIINPSPTRSSQPSQMSWKDTTGPKSPNLQCLPPGYIIPTTYHQQKNSGKWGFCFAGSSRQSRLTATRIVTLECVECWYFMKHEITSHIWVGLGSKLMEIYSNFESFSFNLQYHDTGGIVLL